MVRRGNAVWQAVQDMPYLRAHCEVADAVCVNIIVNMAAIAAIMIILLNLLIFDLLLDFLAVPLLLHPIAGCAAHLFWYHSST